MTAELHTLSNGTTVIIDNIPHTEVAALAYYFRIGGRYESVQENGLAHFLEHMAFKGTQRFNANELSIAMDDLGAKSNAFTSRDATSYYMVGGAEDIFQFNDYLSDMAINLSLPAAEIEMERGAILSEIDMYADDPSSECSDNLFSAIYPNQAMGRTILGPKSNIETFNRSAFENFRTKHYHTGNLIVTVSGNVDTQAILKDIEKRTANMPTGPRSTHEPATFTAGQAQLTKPFNQVNLMLAFEASTAFDHARFDERVLNAVLSDGMSSRLLTEIREKRGLVYGVGAQTSPSLDTGSFFIYAGTSPENVEKLMPVLSDELNKISQYKVTDAELARAKKQILTSSRMQKDSVTGRMQGNAGNFNLLGRLPDSQMQKDMINGVTKDDVLNAAQRVFSGKMSMSSVGAKNLPDYSAFKASLR